MIKVGITGGIGSGKTTVCEVFLRMGIPIYNADSHAKSLMNTNIEIKSQLISRFGENIFKNNQLDRTLLAEIIFNDKEALEFVNSIVHPVVAEDFHQWSTNYNHLPYVLEEAALLFESGGYKQMNQAIMVYASEEIRINRVIKRDGVTKEQVKKRIKNQLSDEIKLKNSNFVIYNDNSKSVIEQIIDIDNKLKLINDNLKK